MSADREIIHFAHANGFPGKTYSVLLDSLRDEYGIIAVEKLGHSVDYPVNNNWSNLADEIIAHVEQNAGKPVIAQATLWAVLLHSWQHINGPTFSAQ